MAAVIAHIENHRANTVSDALHLYIVERLQKQQTEELRAHNAAMRQEQAAQNAAIRCQQQQAHQHALYNQTMDNMLAGWLDNRRRAPRLLNPPLTRKHSRRLGNRVK